MRWRPSPNGDEVVIVTIYKTSKIEKYLRGGTP